MNGWIKLHRKIIDNPVFDNPDLFHLFVYCLIAANHNPTMIVWNGEEKNMERGSFISGRKSLSEKLKQSESKIYRNLKTLEKLNIITQKSNNRFTLINVVNYCNYQGSEFENEQQMNNQRTTNEQQMNTVKNIRTKEIKNKELKHICESSDSYTPEFEEFYKNYPRNKDKGKAFKAWKARIKEKIPAEVLITAAKHYAAECKLKHTSEEYIKYPATFLSKEARSWEDYQTPQRGSKPLTYEAVVTEEERLENERIIQKYARLGGDAVVPEAAQ